MKEKTHHGSKTSTRTESSDEADSSGSDSGEDHDSRDGMLESQIEVRLPEHP